MSQPVSVPDARTIQTVLIANRGEIAVRVIRTCRSLGLRTVAVYSDADRDMPHVRLADESVHIGPPEAGQSYLDVERILQACRSSGADAVHPGYGFLSENAGFARALDEAGIVFIGPRPDTIERMGDKIRARQIMEASGVPVVPGYHDGAQDEAALVKEAERIGYPVMIKASAGGGGRGMRVVQNAGDFGAALESARREAQNAFGDDRVFLEKFVTAPRHIEIQVFGDSHGNIVHLFERECSIQRRHQKVIEESPSPALDEASREAMAKAAVEAARAVDYLGAGTVEFIYSDESRSFYFLEMNTRLQVEHPVTELVTGTDLVAEQIRAAAGLPLSFTQADLSQSGHAIEARLYAEDPAKNFLPSTGRVHVFDPAAGEGVRVDGGVESGDEISIYYDPMAAKIIAHGANRAEAIDRLLRALRETVFFGPANNLTFLQEVLAHRDFRAGKFTTGFLDQHFAGWRGPVLSPAQRETARLAAGLLFFEGAANEPAASVANTGGDVAPWHDLEGFALWS